MPLELVHCGRATSSIDQRVPLICPIRNEIAFLPHFVDHYRRLGIGDFIFIDNASTDDGPAFLAAQPDCIVYRTADSYRESNFATDWINEIIEERQIHGWLLYVDIDEFLVLPSSAKNNLVGYCANTEKANSDSVYAMMLDMYPAGDFLGLRISSHQSLTEQMNWFDTDYAVRQWPKPVFRTGDGRPKPQVIGGPRCRLFSNVDRELARSTFSGFLVNKVDRFINIVPKQLIPALARVWPAEMPALQKTPLNIVRPGFRYLNSHTSTNTRFSRDLLVLLHYKFCAELQARIRTVWDEGNHYRRGLHYLQLDFALKRINGSLSYPGSARFTGPELLERLGLLGPASATAWLDHDISVFRTIGRV